MMTSSEFTDERAYRIAERIGILTDGRREPTGDEIRMARAEAEAAVLDLERQAHVQKVFDLSMGKKFERNLKRRFGK